MKRHNTGKRPTRRNGHSPTKREPSYFLSLSLENVRCFGPKQTLDLSDGNGRPNQWTVILGNNGTGKTTLLQSLMLPDTFRMAHVVRFASPDRSASGLGRMGPGGQSRFDIAFAIGAHLDSPASAEFRRAGFQINFEGDPFFGDVPWNRDYDDQIPFVSAYGADRRLERARFKEESLRDAIPPLFFEHTKLLDAETWLLNLDYSASKQSPVQAKVKALLGRVVDVLRQILPDVDDVRIRPPTAVGDLPSIEFKTPYGWLHLFQLGYGFRTMIAWVVDFVSRLFDNYPDSTDPLGEAAVVLIDEIDLHLHPAWQRRAITYLTERFRNTQFIATAHSPLVVQAAADAGANIVVLRRESDHVVIDNNPESVRGWQIDQILTSELFGLRSARPPRYDDLVHERMRLLTKARLTKADKSRLTEIEAEIADLPPGRTADEARTMSLLAQSLQLLEGRQEPRS